MTRADPDALLLRRARRTLAVQHIAALAVILLVVGGIVLLFVVRGQRSALVSSLRQTAATEEDVVDPPAGSWIFRLDAAGKLSATDDPPDGFPDRDALDRVRAGGPAETTEREMGDVRYLVVTRRRGAATVQVVGSLAVQEEEMHRLLAALAGAELLGLLGAAGSGYLLARRATAPLGDALGRQRRFVADASHELRTPLAQLHTRAQLLRSDLREPAGAADVVADVDRLVAGTRELGEVVEDLLLSTQGAAGDEAEVDLGVLAAGVLAAAGDRARARQVELGLVTDPDQPSLVRGRAPALRRVLTGLVDNALSHTDAGGHVTIELGRRPAARQVTVQVRDDGTGFDPADARRIFDRFARGHDDRRRFGLGLALAREVITGHGGTIEANSAPGQGAVFTIRLPAS